MSWLWLWLPFAALLSGPPGEPGSADLPALTLRWDAPEPCPDEAQVRQRFDGGAHPGSTASTRSTTSRSSST